MALEAGQAYVDLVPRIAEGWAKKVGTDLETATAPVLERVSKKFDSLGDSLMGFGRKATMFVTLPLAAVGLGAIKLASDLNESTSKARVVFGEFFGDVQAWAQDSATKLLMSRQEALENASTFGNLFRALGLGIKPAADMSERMVQLAADLASFNNTSVQDAFEALRSGLVGEVEPLRRYGVSLSAARVEQEAHAAGINKTYQELTAAEKAQLAYKIVLEDTTTAQGDVARTLDGTANQTRVAEANFKNLGAEIGTKLLPIANRILRWANRMLKAFEDLDPKTQDIILAIGGLAAAIGPLSVALGGVSKALGLIAAHPVVAAIVAIALAATYMALHWDEVTAKFEEVKREVFDWLEQNAPQVLDVINGIGDAVDYVGKHWREGWDAVRGAAEDAWAWLDSNVGPVVDRIETTFTDFVDFIVNLAGILWQPLVFAWEELGIEEIVGATLDALIGVFRGAWEAIQGIVDGALSIISGLLDVFDGIITLDVGQVWNGIKEIISGVWDSIIAVIGGALTALGALISGAFTAIGAVIGAAWEGIKAGASLAWEGIKAVVMAVVNTLVSQLSTAFNGVVAVLGGIWEGLKSVWGAAWDVLSGIVTGAIGVVKKAWNAFVGFWNDIEIEVPGVDVPLVGEVGGFTVGLPDLPKLHAGGIVPGPPGVEVLAMLRAGELVTPREDVGATSAASAGDSYTFYVRDEADIVDELEWRGLLKAVG